MQTGHKPRVLTAAPPGTRLGSRLAPEVYKVPKSKRRKPRALMKFNALWSARGYIVEFPIMTQSECGTEGERHTKAGRAKTQRAVTMIALDRVPNAEARHRVRKLRFVRFSPGELDEGDNLNSSFKHIRDQVCAWLAGENTITGEGDDSARSGLKFEYAQAKQAEYGVRIEMSFGGQP